MNQTQEILRLNRALAGERLRHERTKNDLETLTRKLESARILAARYQREHYRLRRIEVASGRLAADLEAKSRALEFSVQRNTVLRRQLSKALGGKAYRASRELEAVA